MTPEFQAWVALISNNGVPICLLIAIVLAGFKLIPSIRKRLKTADRQSEVLARSLPNIEGSLCRMAQGTEDQNTLLRAMDRKLDRILEKS